MMAAPHVVNRISQFILRGPQHALQLTGRGCAAKEMMNMSDKLEVDVVDVGAQHMGVLALSKKPRRTAVERAEESLNKAKAKARLKLLRLAHGHVEEAMTLVTASGDISFRVYAGQASETVNMRDLLIDIRAAIRQEIGE
jgi:hypothetical protein